MELGDMVMYYWDGVCDMVMVTLKITHRVGVTMSYDHGDHTYIPIVIPKNTIPIVIPPFTYHGQNMYPHKPIL